MSTADSMLDQVVEQVCGELRGRVPRAQVRALAADLLAGYGEPTITAYIPILLQRRLHDSLRRAP